MTWASIRSCSGRSATVQAPTWSAKRLERGRFQWPATSGGAVSISAAQLGYLLEGIDWRNPVRIWRPSRAG